MAAKAPDNQVKVLACYGLNDEAYCEFRGDDFANLRGKLIIIIKLGIFVCKSDVSVLGQPRSEVGLNFMNTTISFYICFSFCINSTAFTVTMSFGYSVGDCIAILHLANKIRERFADAPEQFKAVSNE